MSLEQVPHSSHWHVKGRLSQQVAFTEGKGAHVQKMSNTFSCDFCQQLVHLVRVRTHGHGNGVHEVL
jgi:hypothetical protein